MYHRRVNSLSSKCTSVIWQDFAKHFIVVVKREIYPVNGVELIRPTANFQVSVWRFERTAVVFIKSSAQFKDPYLFAFPQPLSWLGRSVVIHSSNATRLACGNITSPIDGTSLLERVVWRQVRSYCQALPMQTEFLLLRVSCWLHSLEPLQSQ